MSPTDIRPAQRQAWWAALAAPLSTALCDAMPWDSPRCILRNLTVQAFAGGRLGMFALALAVLALLTRWRTVGLVALAAAGAGLVLYSTRWAAPAALLAGLALLPAMTAGPAR